ncbi:MAG: hypothetical protein BSOLF_0747 [Candidatus Carbobacillus altaicus]|uniref:M23ase beta-sheet core domain-containing protein n=1 Tax=Candidatus Carbonibacillus altaicus TaxID=2163959 RepID=A0A2R6Y0K4_9BACL|nr:MAG: hypothetical protein BSOLF_0747 [Candidatus Carbobacillus altaicus]
MKKLLSQILILSMLLFLLMRVFAQAQESIKDFIFTHQQPYPGVAYGTEVTLQVNTSLKHPSIFYRHSDDENWKRLPLLELNKNNYIVTLPIEITRPGGFEYYFAAQAFKSEVYSIDTDYSPLMEIETSNSIGIMGSKEVSYDIDYYNGKLPNGKIVTIKAASPISTDFSVTSKLLELRSCCSNPHMGVDFGTNGQIDKDVKAAFPGRVYFTGFDQNGAGKYIIISHNADGTIPSIGSKGDFSTIYMHLNSFNVSKDASVTANQLIAKSGNTGSSTGPHLDFRIVYYKTSSSYIVLPNKYFFNTSGWNNGLDLDFIQPPRFYFDPNYGTMVDVIVYPKGATDSLPTVRLHIKNGTSYDVITLTKQGTSDRYYAYLVGRGYDNKTVQVFLSVERKKGGTNESLGFITRPLQYYSSDVTPVNVTAPSNLYSVFIQYGAIRPFYITD